jgi:hypothetical protein
VKRPTAAALAWDLIVQPDLTPGDDGCDNCSAGYALANRRF